MDLKIDVSNICNYLLQEKVAEFTRYSPEELFKTFVETYHREDIVNKINMLIDLESKDQDLTSDLNKIIVNKKAIEKIIENMSKGLQKIKEKEESEKKVMLMNSKKKWLIYELERKEYMK